MWDLLFSYGARPFILVVVGTIVLLSLPLSACAKTAPMLGTVLTSSDPAPSFRLSNQFGQPVKLADYRGKVVVLTFLYTYCPDICPIVTSHLRETYRMLGDDSRQVAFVAISVDPERDTVQRAHDYSEEWGMLEKWAYLVGDAEQLSSLWRAYYIGPAVDERVRNDQREAAAHSDVPHPASVEELGQNIAARYTVTHSAPVYLIDREGRMRVLFTLPFDPSALAHDVRLLLN